MITALAATAASLALATLPAPPAEAPAPAEPAVVIRSGLALAAPGPRAAARSMIRIDPIEAQLVAGTFVTPKEGAAPVPSTDPAKPARTWTAVTAKPDGTFEGGEDSAFGGGWVYATADCPAPRVMLLEASGHGSVFVNGEPRGGDPYSWGFVRIPVQLRAGTNEFLFSVGRGRLSARLVPAPSPAFVSDRDVLAPSLVAGRANDGPVGVVVVNASGAPLQGARIRIASDLPEKEAWVELHAMPALTEKKVALPARFTAESAGAAGSKRTAQVTLVDRDGKELSVLPVQLSTVSSSDRRVVTRISTIDGSAQYYAVQPSTADRAKGDPMPGILFSVHGAGVDATGQAGSYAPKKEAHVVAPTNRRPFGFDWEDWGRLDFAEAVAHARANLVNDPQRSWLSGHSMGGHGTWQLGAHFPGEFAAIAPSAGWISFASYTGATAGGPAKEGAALDAAQQMLNRAGRASDTLALKENYLQQGVYVLHGDADDNVPVGEAREMFRQLAAISHPDFEYYERPGAGHWWGNQCVDWPALTQFLFRHVLPEEKDITHVRFRTASPQVSNRDAWVRILQQEQPYEVSGVDVRLDAAKRTITGTTQNVRMLDLVPTIAAAKPDAAKDAAPAAAGTPAPAPGDVTIVLDGQTVMARQRADRMHVRLVRAPGADGKPAWSLDPACRDGGKPAAVPADEKKPARGGPFKNAFVHGFVAVVGTQGDAAGALLMQKARYDADQWWVRGNGRFEILLDTAFDPAQYRGRNVVLYGNHDQNAAWQKVLGDACPIDVRNGAFAGPTGRHAGDDVAVMFVHPRADCDQGQVGVVAATGAKGMRAAMRTPVFSAGVGIPDLVAFRAAMLTEGATGVIEAGFFGNDWSVDRGTWMRR